LAIAGLSVVVRGALIGWVLPGILLWVLLPKHGRTESSRNHQHCHPVAFHGSRSPFPQGRFLGGSYALEDALAWPNLTS
jgi:hypothetical protein